MGVLWAPEGRKNSGPQKQMNLVTEMQSGASVT